MTITEGFPIEVRLVISLLVILTHIYFSEREIKKRGPLKQSNFIARKNEYIALGFIGGWNTKYHLGLIAEIVLVIISFLFF